MAESKDAKKTESKEGKGGGKKSLIIIIAAVVVAAAAAGGGTWFFLSKGHPPAPAGEAAKAEPVEEEKPDEGPPVFQPLEPIVVNLSGGSEAIMRVAISVQLRSDKDKEKLMGYMPKIQGDLMLLFSGKTGEELLTQEGKLSLISETKHTINKALGVPKGAKPSEHPVQAVSFTEMIIQ